MRAEDRRILVETLKEICRMNAIENVDFFMMCLE